MSVWEKVNKILNFWLTSSFLWLISFFFVCAFVKRPFENNHVTTRMVLIVVAYLGFTAAAVVLRLCEVLDHPQGWVRTVLGNMTVCVLATLVSMFYVVDDFQEVVEHAVIAFSVFSLLEIMKPYVDFGMLQLFIQAPLQSLIKLDDKLKEENKKASVKKGRVPWFHFFLYGLALVLITSWNSLTTVRFYAEEAKKKAVEAKKKETDEQLPSTLPSDPEQGHSRFQFYCPNCSCSGCMRIGKAIPPQASSQSGPATSRPRHRQTHSEGIKDDGSASDPLLQQARSDETFGQQTTSRGRRRGRGPGRTW